MENTKFKEFMDIMAEIDHQIVTNPKYRLEYIHQLDEEIEKLNDELAKEGIPRKQVDPFEVAVQKGLKYIEFNKEGKIIGFWCEGKAKDFRK